MEEDVTNQQFPKLRARPGLLVRIYAFLTGGEVIWIKDFQGKVRSTVAYMNGFGSPWCHVYWFTKAGHCVLRANGTVDPRSQSFHVDYWKKA